MKPEVNPAVRYVLVNALLNKRLQRLRQLSAEAIRRLLRRPRTVRVFLELDDPYSYLLAHYLPALEQSFDIELEIRLCEALGEGYKPRPDMLAEYAALDCERLAMELGIPFLDKGKSPPVEHRKALLESLAGNQDDTLDAIEHYWRGDTEAISRRVTGSESSGKADPLVQANSKLLAKLGHYNSATMHYAGEWYWGVDRLHYLVERLQSLGAARTDKPGPRLASIQQAMQVNLPVAPPSSASELPPLELFHSFRSPYSYLALQRVIAIADAFGLELRIRPVLPMVMRGLQVPKRKLLYILKDACREARRMDIPFGRISDPVGSATERSLAVFFYAVEEKRERDFVLNVGEAIWSQAVDVATDKGMRKVTEQTGLFWPGVLDAMQDDDWRARAEANRDAMMESGSWGVPTLRIGEFVTWGQDRDWLLVRHLEELCDTGEGILV